MSEEPSQKSIARKTFRLDLGRGFCFGFVEACWESLFLLVAIRVFQGGADEGAGTFLQKNLKALIMAGGFIGLFLTPFTLSLLTRIRLPVSTLAAGLLALSGTIVGLTILADSLEWFVLGVTTSHLIAVQSAPLRTQIYSANYTNRQRGTRFATALLLAAVVSSIYGPLGGDLLDADLANYRWLLGLASLASFAGVFFTLQIPSKPLERKHVGNPWNNLRLLKSDRTFGIMIAAWFLMGTGNLMMRPLRMEYITQDTFGIGVDSATAALLTLTIPNVFRLGSIQLWGFLFDRVAFLWLRLAINLCFMMGILVYFHATSLWLLGVGAAIMGLGMGGGNIAWNLWVTKLAPPEKASAYMSIHTVFTGVRGSVAPFLGYYLLAVMSPAGIAWIAAGGIIASGFIFYSLRADQRIR